MKTEGFVYPEIDAQVTALFDDVILPEYETEDSACADIRVYFKDEFGKENGFNLFPGETLVVGTGISVDLPSGYKINIYGRSGMAAKLSLALTNGVGIIDPDYPNELGLILTNHGKKTIHIKHQDRMGQIEIAPIYRIKGLNVKDQKRTAGFGHTGFN